MGQRKKERKDFLQVFFEPITEPFSFESTLESHPFSTHLNSCQPDWWFGLTEKNIGQALNA